jgi:hypothetical protein
MKYSNANQVDTWEEALPVRPCEDHSLRFSPYAQALLPLPWLQVPRLQTNPALCCSGREVSMSIKEAQKPAREFRPLFERAMTLIQQRYPDWVEASRLNRKEVTISECLDMLICFASDELDAYKINRGEKNL